MLNHAVQETFPWGEGGGGKILSRGLGVSLFYSHSGFAGATLRRACPSSSYATVFTCQKVTNDLHKW